jgi:hypothetical protein
MGLVRPPAVAEAGGGFRLRRAATVLRHGSRVQSFMYARPVTADTVAWFKQVEYVDPATGNIVGGGSPGEFRTVSEVGDCTGQ